MTGDDRATGGAASPNGAVHSNTSSDTFSSGFTQGRTSGPSPAPSGYAPAGPSHRTDANGGHEAPGTSSGSAGVLTVGRDVRNTQGGAAAPDYARHAQTKFATLRGDDDDDDEEEGGGRMATSEMRALYKEASAFEGVAVISMIEREVEEQPDKVEKALEITMEDGVTITVELDSGEKRLNDLGYKQELKRDMVGLSPSRESEFSCLSLRVKQVKPLPPCSLVPCACSCSRIRFVPASVQPNAWNLTGVPYQCPLLLFQNLFAPAHAGNRNVLLTRACACSSRICTQTEKYKSQVLNCFSVEESLGPECCPCLCLTAFPTCA